MMVMIIDNDDHYDVDQNDAGDRHDSDVVQHDDEDEDLTQSNLTQPNLGSDQTTGVSTS